MKKLSSKLLTAALAFGLMMLALLALGGCTCADPQTGSTDGNVQSNFLAEGTGATDAASSGPAAADTIQYQEKYILMEMETTATGEVLDRDDLDVVYGDTGGTANCYIGIIDGSHLKMILGERTTTATYTVEGNTMVCLDVTGAALDFTKDGNKISVEFTDEMMGTEGEGFRLTFEKQ